MENHKRASNFSSEEVEKLLQLVEKDKAIIECKKTDRVTVEAKDKCWEGIAVELNSQCGTGRTSKTLKEKYNNLKRTLKKSEAQTRREMYATGGGPPAKKLVSATDEQLLRIVHEKQIHGNDSQYDSDRIVQIDDSIDLVSETDKGNQLLDGGPVEEDHVLDIEIKDILKSIFIASPSNWSKHTPAMLKTPKSAHLKTKSGCTSKSRWDELAVAKKSYAEMEHKMRVKEHEMRVKEHENRLKNDEEDRAQRLLEHQLRMEILRAELESKAK